MYKYSFLESSLKVTENQSTWSRGELVTHHEIESLKPINMTGNGSLIQLYFKTDKEAQEFFPSIKKSSQYTAYLKKDIPEKYHLKKSAYTGDIVLIANHPTFLLQREEITKKHFIRGHHGYDSYKVEDMIGIYFEEGPGFQEPSPVKETKDVYNRIKALFRKP